MEMQVIKQCDTESNDTMEDSLSRFRSILLVIKFSVLAENLCVDTGKLINQLSDIGTGDCSEIHSIVTGSPVESECYSCMDNIEPSEINSDANESCQSIKDSNKKVTLAWIFLIIDFLFELVSVVFDQLSSDHQKSHYALISMVMSFALIVTCVIEIVHKGREEEVTWERRGIIWWFYHPSNKRFGSFKSIFGLISAIFQSIFATISYAYSRRHHDNPIKTSFLPVILAFCLLCSKFCSEQDKVDRDQMAEDNSFNKIV